MNVAILYLGISLIYIFFVCLDGEDIKLKWKQWLADKLDVKPKVVVRYIKPETIKLTSCVALSYYDLMLFSKDKYYIEQLKKRAIECLYGNILKTMIKNNLVSVSQHKDIITDNIIFTGECYINKVKG